MNDRGWLARVVHPPWRWMERVVSWGDGKRVRSLCGIAPGRSEPAFFPRRPLLRRRPSPSTGASRPWSWSESGASASGYSDARPRGAQTRGPHAPRPPLPRASSRARGRRRRRTGPAAAAAAARAAPTPLMAVWAAARRWCKRAARAALNSAWRCSDERTTVRTRTRVCTHICMVDRCDRSINL